LSGMSADGGGSEATLMPWRDRVNIARLFSGLRSEDEQETQAPEWRWSAGVNVAVRSLADIAGSVII
jgi:hypothetical protein